MVGEQPSESKNQDQSAKKSVLSSQRTHKGEEAEKSEEKAEKPEIINTRQNRQKLRR
jgi:hypothetical protein